MAAALKTLALAMLLLVAGAVGAFADPALFSKLATEKFDDIEAGVNALAASGDPQASAVIAALADGRLSYDPAAKALYYTKDGATLYRTAITGFASKDEANALCDKLKAAGKTCFVR